MRSGSRRPWRMKAAPSCTSSPCPPVEASMVYPDIYERGRRQYFERLFDLADRELAESRRR